jgi:hypothetical protein
MMNLGLAHEFCSKLCVRPALWTTTATTEPSTLPCRKRVEINLRQCGSTSIAIVKSILTVV